MVDVHEHDHEHEESYITVVDEDGNESLYQVLFTFESEDFGKNYVLIYPSGATDDDDIELQAYSYVESEDGTAGDLQPIETEEEWDMVDEVLNTFLAEDEI